MAHSTLAPRLADPASAFDAAAAPSQSQPQLVALYLDPCGASDDEWLTACYRIAVAVEPVSARGALLDLGVCTDAEAYALLLDLLQRLAGLGLSARAGIGPSLTLAQLAGLRAPAHAPLALVTPASAPAFLHAIPVALLTYLHPQNTLTPETIERLQRYGLHTLGHVARMSETALRRQFGPVGALLAAVAHGRDSHPLHPLPEPVREHFRLRLACPLSPEHALALLPRLAAQAAARLQQCGRAARELRLRVRWESGGASLARRALRAHIHDPARLADESRQLLTTLLGEHVPASVSAHSNHVPAASIASSTRDAVVELRLTLCDFAPLVPAQTAFWRIRAQRLAAAQAAADTLTRRHGRPLLFHPRLAAPNAIFAEDRYRFALPGDAEPAQPTPVRSRRRSAAPPSDAWSDVPLHRHWW